MWALNYYLTQLSLGCQSSCQSTPRGLEMRCGREGHTRPRGHSENPRCSCQQTPRGLETRCGREGHTRPRGPSESPDGVDPNIRRTIKTQHDGHNSGVKIWSLCSVSSTLSNANLTNKVRGEYISKEVFLRPLFVRLSFIMRLLSLRRYVSSIHMWLCNICTYAYMYLYVHMPLCIYIYIHVCINVFCLYACMYVCIYEYMLLCMYAWMYVCMHSCMYVSLVWFLSLMAYQPL